MRKLISILGISLLSAACAGAGASGSPGVTPVPHYNVATASDQLVLQITTGGGLAPISVRLTDTPWFALYGDGRIIVRGPAIGSYPGPVLPNLRLMQVTPAEIQKILAAADQAGLLGPDANFNATDIFDASSTSFTTTVDGKTHTIGAYALGYPVVTVDAALTEARKKLSGFSDKARDLATFLGREISDAGAYDATSMRIFTSPTDLSDPDLKRQVVAWPLTADPGTIGEVAKVPKTRCLVLTGPDLETLLTVARTANTLTTWTYGADRYSVYVRPLYPDETGCPAS